MITEERLRFLAQVPTRDLDPEAFHDLIREVRRLREENERERKEYHLLMMSRDAMQVEIDRLRRIEEAARKLVSEYYERTDARDTTLGTAFVPGEPITKLRDLLAWSYKSDPVSEEQA